MDILRFGDKGPQVEYIQLALSRLGYSGIVDGIFGAETRRNVTQLQNDNGLSPDGIVGEKTWQILQSAMKITHAYLYPKFRPLSTSLLTQLK